MASLFGPRTALLGALQRYATGLRFPYLFALTAGLFALDLLTPDPVPFLDEAVLMLLMVLLGNLRNRSAKAPNGQSQAGGDSTGATAD